LKLLSNSLVQEWENRAFHMNCSNAYSIFTQSQNQYYNQLFLSHLMKQKDQSTAPVFSINFYL